ncbi:MAG: anti-sigma factor [Acidobacteriota bacterium]
MTTEEARELGALYALGVLDEESARDLRAKLNGLPDEVQREIAELESTAALIPLGGELPNVPLRIRQKLLEQISKPGTSGIEKRAEVVPLRMTKRPAPPVLSYLLIAASIILAIASTLLFRQNLSLGNEVDNLTRRLDAQTRQLLAERRRVDEVVANATRMVSLSGDAGAPQASARLFWDTNREEWVIYFFNLPAAPSDKDYQLWYITDDQRKVSAKVFRNEKDEPTEKDGWNETDGRVELRLALPREIVPALAATAVTLEPRGGSPQPTGQLVLKGAI